MQGDREADAAIASPGRILASRGALAFANATVHLTATEWAGMQADAEAAALVAAIAPKASALEPGAELVPGT